MARQREPSPLPTCADHKQWTADRRLKVRMVDLTKFLATLNGKGVTVNSIYYPEGEGYAIVKRVDHSSLHLMDYPEEVEFPVRSGKVPCYTTHFGEKPLRLSVRQASGFTHYRIYPLRTENPATYEKSSQKMDALVGALMSGLEEYVGKLADLILAVRKERIEVAERLLHVVSRIVPVQDEIPISSSNGDIFIADLTKISISTYDWPDRAGNIGEDYVDTECEIRIMNCGGGYISINIDGTGRISEYDIVRLVEDTLGNWEGLSFVLKPIARDSDAGTSG